MPSRVIHIRLDDWALLGCHDIVKSADKEVSNMPMATIVRHVVNALVRNMQMSEKIPVYNREDRLDRLQELYSDEPLKLDVTLDNIDVELSDESTRDAEIDQIVIEALKKIGEEGEPEDISKPVEISESSIPEGVTVVTAVDIMTQECEPFSSFKKKAPKDRFIEWAEAQDNSIIQQAVAIIYTGLPQELWGSDKAEFMIAGLLERHRASENKTELDS